MNRDDLVRALALLIALEQPSAARAAAAQLPEFINILDLLQAKDGLENLAHAINEKHRNTAA